jgi:rubrerythrin
MAKTTINAKEILADIKTGMDDAALMEKYQLSDKGLQSLFKKLADAGVLKQAEPENTGPEPEESIHVAWKCPACAKPQTRQSDVCPDCGVIVAKFIQPPAKGELDQAQYVWKCSNCGTVQPKSFDQCPECGAVGSRVKTQLSEQGEEIKGSETQEKSNLRGRKTLQDFRGRIYEASSPALDKFKSGLRKPYVAAIAGAAIMLVVMVVFFGLQRCGHESVQSKVATSNPSKVETPDTAITESAKNSKGGLPEEIEEQIVAHYSNLPPKLFSAGMLFAGVKKLPDSLSSADYDGIEVGLIRPKRARILRAERRVPTKEIIDKTNPKTIWCIKLAIETEWGLKLTKYTGDWSLDLDYYDSGLAHEKRGWDAIKFMKLSDLTNFDNYSACLLNVMVTVSQSGKITGSAIDGDSLYVGAWVECPQDWDNICPFGCRE